MFRLSSTFVMKLHLIVLLVIGGSATLFSQNYVFGGGGIGFHTSMKDLDGVLNRFNSSNAHELSEFRYLSSFEIGYARYATISLIELKWGAEGKRNSSKVLGNFIENATVGWRYHYASVNFGYRPFEKNYFTFGTGMNFGQMVTKFSFGGDFQITNKIYALSSDLFVDYALKVRWRRSKGPYLFRIRPFYQLFYFRTDLKDLETGLNSNPNVQFNELLQSFNNYGIRFVLMIPVTGTITMDYPDW